MERWEARNGFEPPRGRSDVESADATYRRAMALADELGMRPLIARCQLGRGSLYRRASKRPQAAEYLAAATAMFGELEMTWWLDQARRETGLLTEADSRSS